MLDYGPYYVLYKLKKMRSQLAYLLGLTSFLQGAVKKRSGGGVELRDAPSSPEPAPLNTTDPTVLVFRDQSPWKVWDPSTNLWLE